MGKRGNVRIRKTTIRSLKPPPAASYAGTSAASAKSYAIFKHPHTTSGSAENGPASMNPAIAGLIDEARLRGTAVKLAAAGRSAGVTTAMT